MNAKYDDETLRRAFAARAADAPPAGELCFSSEQIWDAIETRASVKQRLRIIDHMADCPACAESWRLAMRLGARPRARWEFLLERLSRWTPQPFILKSAALGATALAMMLVIGNIPQPVEPPSLPTPETTIAAVNTGVVNRGSVIEATIPLEALVPREDFRLKWTPIDGATFNLTVTTESSDPIAYLDGLTTAEQVVPEHLLRDLPEGSKVQWFVEATLVNGELTKSPTFISLVR